MTKLETVRPAARTGATLDEAQMARMFDEVAPVYDRLNTVMTGGLDRRWRRRAVAETGLRAGESVLDACCGTGGISGLLADAVGPFGRVEGVDLSPAMIERATRAYRSLVQVHFQVGNALDLPFETGLFDAATIGFGLRNLPDFEAGFRELERVVRVGGRVVCLELSMPRNRALARMYHAAFRHGAPLAARLAGGPTDAYAYLPGSLDGFPSAEGLARSMRAAGLADVQIIRLAGGIVCVHVGTVPGGSVHPAS